MCMYMYIVVIVDVTVFTLYFTSMPLYAFLQIDIYKNPLYSENQHQHVRMLHNHTSIVTVFHYFSTISTILIVVVTV